MTTLHLVKFAETQRADSLRQGSKPHFFCHPINEGSEWADHCAMVGGIKGQALHGTFGNLCSFAFTGNSEHKDVVEMPLERLLFKLGLTEKEWAKVFDQ